MTNEEAKAAMLDRRPVEHDGIIYDRITAISYRLKKDNVILICAELYDKSGHSVTVAPIKHINAVGGNHD